MFKATKIFPALLLAVCGSCDAKDTSSSGWGDTAFSSWFHDLDGCNLTIDVDRNRKVRWSESCPTQRSREEGTMDQAAYDQFRTAWDEAWVNREGLQIGDCAGNLHHFFEDGGSVSTGIYNVCGKGGELRDGMGLPPLYQLPIRLLLNAAHL